MVNMASELVNSATNDKLTEMDWMKNIEICELVARDHRQAKDVIKAIKKRLGSKHSNTKLFAVMLLEMLMNNIGEPVHKQVTETGILPILVKIVKKKSDLPVREKIFLLLDAAQTSVGGASGRFPQYYSAYYELVSAGVQFSQRPRDIPKPHATSNNNENNLLDKEFANTQCERSAPQTQPQKVSEDSILEKAGSALEVLEDVLNAVDAQHPEGAKDEFTLDLVEQCSFQKQRIMQLAMTSRDEKIVSSAIELNEKLERVLHRHDALVSGRTMSISSHIEHERTMSISRHIDREQAEEEEAEQLFRRIRKGKACLRPEDEGCQLERPLGLLGCPVPAEMLHRPLIRPLTVEPKQQPVWPLIMEPKHVRPPTMELDQEATVGRPAVVIPPPPAKHVERERFFKEKKSDVSSLDGHMRSLSLHIRNASSSLSGSMDYSD
ncbi:TOM1-like protein 5 [Olea europaea var. sylvestris]|uniref:TOM1-like protein 5 n=1 Tax=Olea europaea var. sylvestris TaxID=158386 RepID=UPI000C1D788C|nr:TOM1-like protein 5 [Olea europaea var. sylvestris]XP_022894914.1 TOM1-like protein 5 [Olea europaea var. sylvestris]